MWALKFIAWVAKVAAERKRKIVKMEPFVRPGTPNMGVWLIFGKVGVWVSMN